MNRRLQLLELEYLASMTNSGRFGEDEEEPLFFLSLRLRWQ